MKKFIFTIIMFFSIVSISHAIVFTFSDKDYLNGRNFGTLDITAYDFDTLSVKFTAEGDMPGDVSGFGFDFSGNVPQVENPVVDNNPVKWYSLNNLNAIPQPSNRDEFVPQPSKRDFTSGATTNASGNNFNMSDGSITAGQSDTFLLNFVNLGVDLTKIDLYEFVKLTGIRIQNLPCCINEGSLFLVGKTQVPEASTYILLMASLMGLSLFMKRS